LAVSKNATATTVLPDALVHFVINYANNSTLAQGTDTLITDTLPSDLAFETSTSSPDIGMPTFFGGNQWVYNAGNVQPGASGVITLTARRTCPSALGWQTNNVDISSLTLENALGDNTDSDAVDFVLGPPYYVTVQASPQVIEVDMSTTVRITVTDQCLVPIPSATVYITTNLGAFDAAGTQTTETKTTNVNGRTNLTFWSRPPISGTATIEATAVNADGSATGVGYVYIGAGPAKQTILTADPTVLPADGMSTSTLTARVLDTGGNPVPDGFLVGFTTTMGSLLYDYVEDSAVNQSPPGSWTTDTHGQASSGTYIRTNMDGASVYWNFHGNGVSIVYRQHPSAGIGDVYVDGTPLPFINMQGPNVWRAERVYTWSGSPTAAHTLRLAHRAGTGQIFMDAFRSGVATSGGQSIAILTAPTITGTAHVAATAVSETLGVAPVLLPAFADVRFESADVQVSKTAEPARVSIGQRVTFTIDFENTGPVTATGAYIDDTISDAVLSTGWLRDVFFSTAPLTVTPHLHYYWSLGALGPGESGSISFGGIVEPNRYWPSETVATNRARIGTNTVDPRMGNNTARASITIVPSAPASISLTATPGSISVGGATSVLRATVRDGYGNPAPNGTPVTLTTTLGGFPTVQERVRSTTDGVATLQLTSGPTAGTAHVIAAVDSLSDDVDVIFMPLQAYTITVTASPDRIKVGGSTSVIEALVVDQYGNPIVDGTDVSFATSAGSISPTSDSTVDGRAHSVLTSGTEAVTAVVTATVGSATGTTTVVFEPGVPRVRIDAVPRILGCGEVSAITVWAVDQFGNNVADGTVVTFTTSLGYFTLNQTDTLNRTTTGGSSTTGMTSEMPGTAIVRGEVGGEWASVAVVFEPGEPYSIKILDVDPALIQSCVGTAIASAEVRDRFGNLVKDGTVVVFDVIPTGDVEPIDGGRTTNGIARAIISAGTTPTWATVIAWPERYRTSVSDQYGIEFQVGPPDRIDAGAEPPRLLVGGNRATIRTRVFDCGGYPVTDGTVVSYTLVSGQGSLSPQTTTTASGWAYSYLTSPDVTGSAQIRVAAGDREATVLVEYIPGPPSEVVLSADPLSIPADGASSTRIDADISDRLGNAVLDRTLVIFSTDLGRFTTTTSVSAYTSGGKASAILTSSMLPGIAKVEAIAVGARSDPAYVDFYIVPTPTRPPGWSSLYLPLIMKNRYR
jgi:adhesin/invasin